MGADDSPYITRVRTAMDLEDLSQDLKMKVLACKTPEELLELARAEGYELSDEELAAVAGGTRGNTWICPSRECATECDYC